MSRRSKAFTRQSAAACSRPNIVAETGSPLGFDARWRQSPGGQELRKVRNIKPGFKRGLWFGIANAGLETITAGTLPWTLRNNAPHEALKRLDAYESPEREWVDRTPAAARSPRLGVLRQQLARREPANASEGGGYQHLRDEVRDGIRQSLPRISARRMSMKWSTMAPAASDCRSMRPTACTARPATSRIPYQIINWTTPEGGSGPNYQSL